MTADADTARDFARGQARGQQQHHAASERDALLRNEWGGQLICDDRNLVIEEAATAYKDAGQVVRDLSEAGLVVALAAMKPLVTYKKAIEGPPDRTRGKPNRDRWERRDRHARD